MEVETRDRARVQFGPTETVRMQCLPAQYS